MVDTLAYILKIINLLSFALINNNMVLTSFTDSLLRMVNSFG